MLTAKMEKFAQEYAATRDGAKSYRAAYDCKPDIAAQTCSSQASILLSNRKIAARIENIIDSDVRTWNAEKCLKAWIEIGTADPNEYISTRIGCCRHCYGENFRFQWKLTEYEEELSKVERFNARCASGQEMDLPDIKGGIDFNHTLDPLDECPNCRGEGETRIMIQDSTKVSPAARRLYGGVKQTRNGIELILADRMKALENAGRILGVFKDSVRVDASLTAMLTAVKMEDLNPVEAAKHYEKVVRLIPAAA